MKKNNYWLQFIISVLGTAIGVALTFVMNGRLENRRQYQAQRLTAIMIIHDIDNSIDRIKRMKNKEEINGKLLENAMERRDHLETMPYDTVTKTINIMLDQNFSFRFDTSKEKIFNSDLDTWQNLGNMKFIDNVQSFFYDRQSMLEEFENMDLWRKPVSEEEYMQLFMGLGWVTEAQFCEIARPFLKKCLYDKRVLYYIDVASFRVSTLNEYIDNWTALNNENKFLMGITDQELEDYINSIDNNGVAVKKRNLTGSWALEMADDNCDTYTFNADRTFSSEVKRTTTTKWRHWSGTFRSQFNYSGTWEIKGDSLYLSMDLLSGELITDDSELVPEAGRRDSLDAWINRYRENTLKDFRETPDEDKTSSFKARLDSSNDKMEWTDEDGDAIYLKRVN